jgi:hypothetical protein
MSDRPCLHCGAPLYGPETRRYHPECFYLLHDQIEHTEPGITELDTVSETEPKVSGLCELCGLPLPEGSRWTRKYHKDPCAKIVAAERSRLANQKHNAKQREASRHVTRRDPMKMLHLDYVLDKLAGKVVIPKGRGKKINLKGDTLSIYD